MAFTSVWNATLNPSDTNKKISHLASIMKIASYIIQIINIKQSKNQSK